MLWLILASIFLSVPFSLGHRETQEDCSLHPLPSPLHSQCFCRYLSDSREWPVRGPDDGEGGRAALHTAGRVIFQQTGALSFRPCDSLMVLQAMKNKLHSGFMDHIANVSSASYRRKKMVTGEHQDGSQSWAS